LEQRLSPEEERAVIDATGDLLGDAADAIRRQEPTVVPPVDSDLGRREPLRVLGYASNGSADELALRMLMHLINDLPISIEITSARMQASEFASLVETQRFSVVCFADLPPSPPSKTRYLIKRLHATLPDVHIVVGRWAPAGLSDENTEALRAAGASLVVSTLADTRTYLAGLVEIPRLPGPRPTETPA
jgi:hypothetical protein